MIDLSQPIRSGMMVYPGDPAVALKSTLTVEHSGVGVTKISIGSHTGTHLDAPSHTELGGRTLAEISLDELLGEALIIRVPDAQPEQALGVQELGLGGLTEVPRIVVVHTGWDQFFGTERYLKHPFLTASAAAQLCELGMHLLAIDTLSPDRTLVGVEKGALAVHRTVLGADRLIVENLRGLEAVPDRVCLGFFPLNLGEVDGAPVRAVAFPVTNKNECGRTLL